MRGGVEWDGQASGESGGPPTGEWLLPEETPLK